MTTIVTMNQINKVYSTLQQLDKNVEVTSTKITNLKGQIREQESVIAQQESLEDQFREAKRDRVIELGKLLSQHKKDYGHGWGTDWEHHDFIFSYRHAGRFISCSEYPEAYHIDLKQWAKNSTILEEEKKDSSAKDDVTPPEEVESRTSEVPLENPPEEVENIIETEKDISEETTSTTKWKPPKRGKLGKLTWFQEWRERLQSRGPCSSSKFWAHMPYEKRDKFCEILFEHPQWNLVEHQNGKWELQNTTEITWTNNLNQDCINNIKSLLTHMDNSNYAAGNWSMIMKTLRIILDILMKLKK